MVILAAGGPLLEPSVESKKACGVGLFFSPLPEEVGCFFLISFYLAVIILGSLAFFSNLLGVLLAWCCFPDTGFLT